MNVLLIKTKTAGAAIEAYRLLTHGAADNAVVPAAVSSTFDGVSGHMATANGEKIDVALAGIAEVQLGGTVTRGSMLTSDANGKAVVAVPTNTIWGVAQASGVANDVIPMLIAPGVM